MAYYKNTEAFFSVNNMVPPGFGKCYIKHFMITVHPVTFQVWPPLINSFYGLFNRCMHEIRMEEMFHLASLVKEAMFPE